MDGDQLVKFAETIKTSEDFAAFANLLAANLSQRDEWENSNLESFLEAMAAFAETTAPGGAFHAEFSEPTWSNFAQILLAAKVYE